MSVALPRDVVVAVEGEVSFALRKEPLPIKYSKVSELRHILFGKSAKEGKWEGDHWLLCREMWPRLFPKSQRKANGHNFYKDV